MVRAYEKDSKCRSVQTLVLTRPPPPNSTPPSCLAVEKGSLLDWLRNIKILTFKLDIVGEANIINERSAEVLIRNVLDFTDTFIKIFPHYIDK